MNDKLILKDGSVINIESGSSLDSINVVSSTKADMTATWDLLTVENLKTVQVKNNEDNVIGEYHNLVLEDETSMVQSDGTIFTRFRLRQKTEIEVLKERVEELEAQVEIQDEAIGDLGEAVSYIAEGGTE